jgi:hypothetical protein
MSCLCCWDGSNRIVMCSYICATFPIATVTDLCPGQQDPVSFQGHMSFSVTFGMCLPCTYPIHTLTHIADMCLHLCCLPHPPNSPAVPQTYALDNKTLLAIEIPVMALLEAKRYEGYQKTGEVGVLEFDCFRWSTATARDWQLQQHEWQHQQHEWQHQQQVRAWRVIVLQCSQGQWQHALHGTLSCCMLPAAFGYGVLSCIGSARQVHTLSVPAYAYHCCSAVACSHASALAVIICCLFSQRC